MRLVDPDVLEDDRYYWDWSERRQPEPPRKRDVVNPRQPRWWTPERVELLKRLYAFDGMNSKLIARRLGTTFSAVIGKANRLGLEHASPAAQRRRHEARRRRH